MTPYLTIITVTHKRPQLLLRCMESVARQTVAKEIEHIVYPDNISRGVAGMYRWLNSLKDVPQGRYVYLLNDDDVLADAKSADKLLDFLRANGEPAAVSVKMMYRPYGILPSQPMDPPQRAAFGSGNMVVRTDVWREACANNAYAYEVDGDYDFGRYIWDKGHRWMPFLYVFARGTSHHRHGVEDPADAPWWEPSHA